MAVLLPSRMAFLYILVLLSLIVVVVVVVVVVSASIVMSLHHCQDCLHICPIFPPLSHFPSPPSPANSQESTHQM